MSYYRQGPHRPQGIGIGVPRLTPCVKAIMIASAAVWVLQLAFSAFGTALEPIFGVVPALVVRGWLWQPVTYMFLHSPDPFHLLFNMLMLWMFGGELETYWGQRRFLRYYVLCGLGGGIAATLLGLLYGGIQTAIPTIGASGALYGLFVAYGIIYAERTILFMLIFPLKARTMALIMVGLNFFYTLNQSGSGISYIAHLGGALTGFLYLKRFWQPARIYQELKWKLKRRRFKVMPPRDDDRWLN